MGNLMNRGLVNVFEEFSCIFVKRNPGQLLKLRFLVMEVWKWFYKRLPDIFVNESRVFCINHCKLLNVRNNFGWQILSERKVLWFVWIKENKFEVFVLFQLLESMRIFVVDDYKCIQGTFFCHLNDFFSVRLAFK